MDYRNRIFNENCLDTMARMRDDDVKVDLILTSPPYNTGRDIKSERARNNHEGRYDEYSESKTNNEYDLFTVDLFNGYDGILKDNGVVLYNISYGAENPTQMWTCIADVCRKTNFMIADCIVWKKSSALPNNTSHNKLTRICEFVFVLCRKSEYMGYFMNKAVSSVRKDNGQTMYRNIFNYIEAPNNDGSNPLNKATFSTELVRKLLQIYSLKGMIVYDSFMGTGTTAVGAMREGCFYIGSELSAAQCQYAQDRVTRETQQLSLF